MRNILCNVRLRIPILVAKVWQRKLDNVKNLQVKYFTGENIPIYGNLNHMGNGPFSCDIMSLSGAH